MTPPPAAYPGVKPHPCFLAQAKKHDRTNGRPVSRSRSTPGRAGESGSGAATVPGSGSGRYRLSKSFLSAAAGSGYRPGPRHLLIPGSGQRSALAVRRGWFPVAGVRRDDRHGSRSRAGRDQRSAFWRVFRQRSPGAPSPSISGPLGRTGERFPGSGLPALFRAWILGRRRGGFGGHALQNDLMHFQLYDHRGILSLKVRGNPPLGFFPDG